MGTLKLLPRFVVSGALAIGVFSAVLAWTLSNFIESSLLARDATVSRGFVQGIADSQNIAAALQAGDLQRNPGLQEFFTHIAAIPDVLRINVYTLERHMLWSSRPELIGLRFEDNPELERALRDEVVVDITTGDNQQNPSGKSEHVLLDTATARYIENYIPVLGHDHQAVVGVIELYRQPVDLFQAIQSGRRLVWVGACVGGVFLFLCLIGFVRHTERALAEQQRRLVEADALALVGEMSAAVAHSIRNPLGSIRSTAELQREIDGDPQGTQAQVMRDADRIEGLVRTMLTYASPAADPDAPGSRANLHEVLATLAGRLAPEIRQQGKRLELALDGDPGQVAIEPVLITQVLQSLLTNACEATGPGDRIRLQARRHGAKVVISVTDNGVGIEPARLEAVFRPFHTSKPLGFGMGLALARRVAQRAGGDIRIHSVQGRGTSVHLRLPTIDH